MADRMTKKEKREAAKQARLEAQQRAARQRTMRRIYAATAALAVFALIAFVVVRNIEAGRERVASLNELAAEAGCSELETPPHEGERHVTPPATVQYGTNPPTSGDHYGSTAPTGVLEGAIPAELLVHNMEHGHVVFWYDPAADPAIVEAVNQEVRRDDRRRVSVQREGMPQPIGFTSWGRLLRCDGTGEPQQIAAVFGEFASQFFGQGPEGDVPGTPAA